MMNYKNINLKAGKERSVANYHPWVFSGALGKIPPTIVDGDICYLLDNNQKIVATGHYHQSSIMFRVLAFEACTIDKNFFLHRITQAYTLRKALGFANSTTSNAYRLVHGEGDNLSGLIIDIYNQHAVIQCHTIGMALLLQHIQQALDEVFDGTLHTIYYRHAIQKNNTTDDCGFLKGDAHSTIIHEGEVKINVNWVDGQKTGFFLDQRINRFLLAQFCHNKKVLNTFCYTGAFSLHALAAGAQHVLSVDSSAKAMQLVAHNLALNEHNTHHTSVTSDTATFLKNSEDTFDVIVLDPPAFAKNRQAIHNASIAYRNLNALALKKISPNGVLFTFSCSQAIDKELFRKIIFQAAAMSHRNIKVLYTLSQPPDHPVNIYHPEGEYLKGLVLWVE